MTGCADRGEIVSFEPAARAPAPVERLAVPIPDAGAGRRPCRRRKRPRHSGCRDAHPSRRPIRALREAGGILRL